MHLKPILKYPGGKSRETPEILKHIPEFSGRYIEPFIGGGALFFYLAKEGSIINDFNPNLVRFYSEVRDNFHKIDIELAKLKRAYDKTSEDYELERAKTKGRVDNLNEALFYRMRDQYNGKTKEEYFFATIYYFLNKTAYSGIVRHNSKGEYNVPFGRYKTLNTGALTLEHSELLKKTTILNGDFEKVFNMSDKNDFIFLDPPYDSTFSNYGNATAEKAEGFDKKDHIRLANAFKNLEAKALMVIGGTDFIRDLYKDYIVTEYHKKYAVNIKNRVNSSSNHLVIRNY